MILHIESRPNTNISNKKNRIVMNAEEQKQIEKNLQEKVFKTLNEASEVITYFGAYNDGKGFQDDVLLGILEDLRQSRHILEDYFEELNDTSAK